MAIDVLNENDNVPMCRTYAEVYNVREDTGRSKVRYQMETVIICFLLCSNMHALDIFVIRKHYHI